MTSDSTRPVLLLVVCAAPPAHHIDELAALLIGRGWDVHIITTPTAASWIDPDRLTTLTGHPPRGQPRRPDEPKTLPPANAIALVPATFNTINQWAAGINNTLALGILNEALGSHLPIIAAPYVKASLAAHPAFTRNLAFLRDAGVSLTTTEALRPPNDTQPFRWHHILDRLPTPPATCRLPAHGPSRRRGDLPPPAHPGILG